MATPLKPTQIRIRIRDEDNSVIEKMAEDATLTVTDVASMLIRASLKALSAQGETSLLPKLRLDEDGELKFAKAKPKK